MHRHKILYKTYSKIVCLDNNKFVRDNIKKIVSRYKGSLTKFETEIRNVSFCYPLTHVINKASLPYIVYAVGTSIVVFITLYFRWKSLDVFLY